MSKSQEGWSRRDFVGAAALFASAIGVPVAAVKLSDLDNAEAPTDRQLALITEVADLVVPRTQTPGARDVGVGAFVALALAHGLSGTLEPMASGIVTAGLEPFRRRDGSLRHLEWLERGLNRAAGGDFMRVSPTRQLQLVEAMDGSAFVQGAPYSPWVAIKGLILTGYYTSEAGGSKELRYELVPGRWEWDIPINPGDRAFSSDWTAVDFG